jgi:hypothetical protein
MEDWLGCVWENWPGALSKPQSMLAVDTFRGHLSDRLRYRLRNKNTDLVLIPNGMTSQLQPLNVSINKPFKHLVSKHYDAWLNRDNHTLTPSGKIKRTSASVIVEWISKVWKQVPININPQSFSSAVCLIRELERKMTFFGTTVNKMARVHHL